MRRNAVLAGLTAASTLAAVCGTVAPTSAATAHPSGWSDKRLAMQLVLAGVQMNDLSTAVSWAREGVGGIVLFGTPPKTLASQLAKVRAAETVPPFVSSDEEGGEVQRLASLIYALPSAEWMGANRTPSQVHAMAARYGARMKALHVDMDLAPDTDLLVPGRYIAEVHRAFRSTATDDGAYAKGWQRGMRSARVLPVVKHWPGLGHTTGNTDDSLQTTPDYSYMKTHDMRSFEATFKAHAPVAMVGNMVVPGLTETAKTPASLSPRALALLRKQGGPDLVIVTDSLSAGAVRDGLGLSQPQAAVRALESGADMALVDGISPSTVADAIVNAMQSGAYPRSQAKASLARILAAKRRTTPPYTPSVFRPTNGSTGVSDTPTLSVHTADRLGGHDRVHVEVRPQGGSWASGMSGTVTVTAGHRAYYLPPAGTVTSATTYQWRVKSCNTAAYCSPWTSIHTFTTA